MKDSTGLTIIMIVLVLILGGVVWHGSRIEELYKNYRWMYDKQCELIYTTNHYSSTIAKLCSVAIKNGDGLEYWAFDPNDPNKIVITHQVSGDGE